MPLNVYGSVQGFLWHSTCPFLVTFFNSIFHGLRQQPEFLEIMNSRCNSPSRVLCTADFTFQWQELFPSYTEILSAEASKHRSHLWVLMGTALRQCCGYSARTKSLMLDQEPVQICPLIVINMYPSENFSITLIKFPSAAARYTLTCKLHLAHKERQQFEKNILTH